MSISTYAAFQAKVEEPWLNIFNTKLNFSAAVQLAYSSWLLGNQAGVAPTTAAVPTNLTQGAIGEPMLFNSGGVMRIGRIMANSASNICWWLSDRVSHQGGLSGTATGAQTTNLPTAALTRFTSGVGVMIGLEIYTAVGASSTTITVSYTNSAGTAGRTSEAITWGNTGFREINRMMLVPLQSGDVGVKSVESVTAAATTGTIGNFGVTLFKPLFPLVMQAGQSQNLVYDGLLSGAGGLIPVVPSNACLFWVASGSASGSGDTAFSIGIIEE